VPPRGRVRSPIGEGSAATLGDRYLLGVLVPHPHGGGLMQQVILVLGQLSLILAGIVCVVGFVLLIVSMLLATLRKLLEFTRL
jgi:hypothetical protein